MRIRNKLKESWINRSKFYIEHEDEILACTLKVLRIICYMKEKNVSLEYVSKQLNISTKDLHELILCSGSNFNLNTLSKYMKILKIDEH